MRKKRCNQCQKGAMKPVNLPNRHKPTALTAYKARKKSVKRASDKPSQNLKKRCKQCQKRAVEPVIEPSRQAVTNRERKRYKRRKDGVKKA